MTASDPMQSLIDEWRAETEALRHRPHRAPNKDDLKFSSYSSIRERTCSRCGRRFFCDRGGVSYCSKRREQDDRNERRREQRATKSAQHKPKPGKCAVCGAKFADQVRSTLRYCSNACRQRAYRRRSG